jgi:hypothetical protein
MEYIIAIYIVLSVLLIIWQLALINHMKERLAEKQTNSNYWKGKYFDRRGGS